MIQKTIRRAGRIAIASSLPKRPGMNVTQDFLDQLLCGFAKQCEKYMALIHDAPFAYRERQLHSLLAPALSHCTELLLMETPVRRKWSKPDPQQANSHGWVDYWCYLRDIALFLELKHGFCSLRSGVATQDLQSGWEKAIEQLDAIKEDALLESQWCKGSVRIALDVIPLFQSFQKRSPAFTLNEERLHQISTGIVRSLHPKPNWFGLWTLHPKLIGPYECGKRKEVYPAVLFAAYVYEMASSPSSP